MNDKLKKLVDAVAEKETKKQTIKAEYEAKKKVKALTTAERLDRIEKLLGLE